MYNPRGCLVGGRKGQESLLNVVAVVIIASVLFLYFFYVTQGQRIEANALFAKEMKYRYAENVIMNMNYVNTGGNMETYSEIIAKYPLLGNESKSDALLEIEEYLDIALEDYDYHFFVVDLDEEVVLEVNERPDDDQAFFSHRIAVSGGSGNKDGMLYAYLYVW